MKRVIEICLEECANLSIAEARKICTQLGASINCDEAIRAAVLKFKFQFVPK
jgi:hypothetical protein